MSCHHSSKLVGQIDFAETKSKNVTVSWNLYLCHLSEHCLPTSDVNNQFIECKLSKLIYNVSK